MKTEDGETCWVASLGTGANQVNLTVYQAPGGWRWLAHDLTTGSRTGDAAASAEHAKQAAEGFARTRVPGDEPVQWNMAFVRHHAG